MKKERTKRSVVWSLSKTKFEKLVKSCINIAQICRYFELGIKGGNYNTIKRRIKSENIDTSHFKSRNTLKFNWISEKEFLSNIQKYKNDFIKKKILEFGLIENKCKICNQLPNWNNKPLTLHLDHIDGNSTDNRIDNLRFLCPNCHTQTNTYSMGQRKVRKYHCMDCQKPISKNQIRCKPCGDKLRRKVIRPDKETLQKLIGSVTMVDIGKSYGVSDNAVRKWCNAMEIDYKRGRGFWTINK